jgi:hypothetical protein
MRSLIAVVAMAVAAGAPTVVAEAADGPSRYVVTVGNQSAGGDPGVLYVGGPLNIVLRDRDRADTTFRLCITPAPIDQPSCRAGRTDRVISGPAISAPGETRLRFTLAGGAIVERTIVAVTNAAAQREPGPYRILGAAVVVSGANAGAVLRLNRAMPRNGEDRPPVTLGASLRRDEVLPRGQRFYGGITPSQIGRRDRHCYATEVQQLVPRTHFEDGRRAVVGIRIGHRLVAAASVVVRRGIDITSRGVSRRAGC